MKIIRVALTEAKGSKAVINNVFSAVRPKSDSSALKLEFLKDIISKSGPEQGDYAELDSWFGHIHKLAAQGILLERDLINLRLAFGNAMSINTLQGLVMVKPYGYAGDFEIIDKIYTRHVSPNPTFSRWDQFFHSHAAPNAVRNRKRYFHEVIRKHLRRTAGIGLRVLIVGSGPGRDLFEHFSADPNSTVLFNCLDIDSHAIAYAKVLNGKFVERITFLKQNVLRYSGSGSYDLIWAAGIFDYFSDSVFQFVLRRLRPLLADGGEIVIGNFSTGNPSRAYMEFGNWFLHYRTSDDLVSLALGCGVPVPAVHVNSEIERVNLFLHVEK